jgi:hypothetical protein
MATATRLIRRNGALTTEPAIINPLVQLRRQIRFYVILEGLATAVIFACLWVGLTFLADWGLLFQLAGIDYVRDASDAVTVTLRALFLTTLIGGLLAVVAFKIVYRLVAALRPAALALVLERRFPGILGDRLVTAVELGDPQLAARYGYSWVMVEETASAAAERVGNLAIGRVFNWGRLWLRVALAVVLALGVAVFALLATTEAALWGERNILLEESYWPRQTMVELPEYRDTDTRAVPFGGEQSVRIIAYKWVIADRSTRDGWRRLAWDDLFAAGRPWELATPVLPEAYYAALPEAWKNIPLDTVEVRLRGATLGTSTPSPDAVTWLNELGAAVLDHLAKAARQARADGRTQLDEANRALVPETWRGLPLDQLEEHLAAARRLTPSEIKRLTGLLHGGHLLPADYAQAAAAALSPVKPVIFTTPLLQRIVASDEAQIPVLGYSEADWELLPSDWRALSAPQLEAKLNDLAASKTPAHFGELIRIQLLALFDELARRTQEYHIGRRTRLRQLAVPDKIAIEFEQVLTDEERARSRPRVGKPLVNRLPDTNEYQYDFKKIERELRFRVLANDETTPWYLIKVKPIPTLRRLTRYQKELGYLHGSNERVETGPFPVSLEGDESRFDVPAGTLLTLRGESYKPLQWVRVVSPEQNDSHRHAKALGQNLLAPLPAPVFGAGAVIDLAAALVGTNAVEDKNPHVAALRHTPGSEAFELVLQEIMTNDLRLRLEFEDTDGITGSRRLYIPVAADKEPEFVHLNFEVVRRELVTGQVIIPFSGRVRDDNGLTRVGYEVTVTTMDGKVVHQQVLPLRHFAPFRLAEPARSDLVFERRDQLTLNRLLAGDRGLLHGAPLNLLGRVPFAGPIGLCPAPAIEIPREHSFEYRVRTGTEAPIAAEDEFLDTLLFRAQLSMAPPAKPGQPAPKAEPLAPPYRLAVRLVAVDNRVRTDPAGQPVLDGQLARSPEAFEFLVVEENELLIEAGKREADLHENCSTIVENLKKNRDLLRKLRTELETYTTDDDFRRAAADALDALKAIQDGRDIIERDVVRDFRLIWRELVLNRVKPPVLERIDEKICRPLERIIMPGQHFDRAREAVAILPELIEKNKDKTSRVALEDAVQRTDELVIRLEEILNEMEKLIEYNQALEWIRDIINAQKRINEAVERLYKEKRKQELEGDLKPMKP